MTTYKVKILVYFNEQDTRLHQELAESPQLTQYSHFTVAETSDDVLKKLDSEDQSYDVVLLSEGLGNVSGIDILKKIRSRHSKLDVIIIGQEDKTREALEAGAYQYFANPFNTSVLAWHIRFTRIHHLSIEDIGKELLDELEKVVPYTKATLQLIAGDTRRLVAFKGFDVKNINRQLLRPLPEDPLILAIVEKKEPVIVGNTESLIDNGWESTPETKDVKSWCCIPLIYRDEIVGVLTLDHASKDFFKPEQHEAHIKDTAEKAAVALWHEIQHKATLRDQEQSHIVNEIMREVGKNIRSQEMLRTFLWKITDQLKCDHCTYFHHAQDAAGNAVLKPRESCGYLSDEVKKREPFKLKDNSIVGAVYKEKQTRIIGDIHSPAIQKLAAPARRNIGKPRSLLVVPVKIGEQPIGVISIDKDEFSYFTDDDRLLVEALALRFGVLFTRVMTIEAMHDISLEMTKQADEHQLPNILKLIVDTAEEVTHTVSGVIYVVEKMGDTFIPSAHYPDNISNLPDEVIREFSGNNQILTYSAEMVEKLYPDLINKGVKSIIAAPLVDDGKLVGVLELHDLQERKFDGIEQYSLMILANQGAIAIQQTRIAKQADETWEHTESLYEASNQLIKRVLSSRDPENILTYLVDLTLKATKAKWVSVVLFNQDKDEPEKFYTHGEYHERYKDRIEEIIRPNGYTRDVYRTGEYKAFSDTSDAQGINKVLRDENIKAALCLPLSIVGEYQQLGVIWIHYENKREFPEDQIRIWQLYASTAATTYYNANRIMKVYRVSQSITSGIESDYGYTRLQSQKYAETSLRVAIAGMAIIFFGILLVLLGNQSVGIPSAIAGVITEAISLLFFTRSDNADKRMDNYHHELLQIRQFENLLAASDELSKDIQSPTKIDIIQKAREFWLAEKP